MDTWFDLVHSREKKPNNTDPVVETISLPEPEPEIISKTVVVPVLETKKRFKGK